MTVNIDPGRVLQAAAALDRIGQDTMTGLSRYVTMNQNLNGTGFNGIASLASVNTSVDVSHTGQQVHQRFTATTDQMRKAVAHYKQTNHDNASALTSVATTQV
ncbi:hypothetical protein [Mycolicibacterium mucogenicum]|uniref:hypothetical protein n=1 Tax=Mycolicibacterium mucogenicum TaxID=56689 RepID=UPI000B27D31D|nr:hypothetical protein [Mycolicibacterium mucogenicum]